MFTSKKTMAAIAVILVVLLGALGIDRIGGETWVTAAAKAEAGVYAELRPYSSPPAPFLRDYFVPVLLVVLAVALALIGAVLNRFTAWEAHSGESNEEPPTDRVP